MANRTAPEVSKGKETQNFAIKLWSANQITEAKYYSALVFITERLARGRRISEIDKEGNATDIFLLFLG